MYNGIIERATSSNRLRQYYVGPGWRGPGRAREEFYIEVEHIAICCPTGFAGS